jgi:hypothetical protein
MTTVVNGSSDAVNGHHTLNGDRIVYDHERVAHFIGMSSRLPQCEPAPYPSCVTGANTLEKAAPGKVADFVKSQGGHTVITKVRIV